MPDRHSCHRVSGGHFLAANFSRAKDPMRRIFLLVLLLGGLIMAVGLLALGAFPPDPTPRPVTKLLPNDRFSH
jgi:hypothetical protein